MKAANKGLAYWEAAVVNRETLDENLYAELCAHPRFVDACKLSEKASLDLSMSDPMMGRIIRDMSGAFYGIFASYLDARGGLTLTSIQQFCEEAGLASPGRSAALLFQLRMQGYVKRDPVQPNRRIRRYIPAPAMTNAMRRLFLCNLNAFALIEPELQELIDRIEEPEPFRLFLLGMGDSLATVVKRGDRTPITMFAERNFGMQILYYIMSTGEDGDVYPPKGVVRTSVAELTKAFPVSRSHVVKLLKDAERNGLLHRHTEDGRSILTDTLRDAMTRFHASIMLGHAANSHRALQILRAADAAQTASAI